MVDNVTAVPNVYVIVQRWLLFAEFVRTGSLRFYNNTGWFYH